MAVFVTLLLVGFTLLCSETHGAIDTLPCRPTYWKSDTRVTILQAGPERSRPLEVLLGSVPHRGPIRELSSVYYQHYAKKHGYTYARVVLAEFFPRTGKATAIYHHLQQSDLVVFVDFAVMIPLESSIFCLLEKWKFLPNSPATVLAPRSLLGANSTTSSFMVWKKSELANVALSAWHTAMQQENAREPDPHVPVDEAVWFTKIQQYLRPSELVVAPCDEANGYSQLYKVLAPQVFSAADAGPQGCAGKHVARLTRGHDVLLLYKYLIHALAQEQGRRVLQPGAVDILQSVPNVPLLQYDEKAFATKAPLPYPKLLQPWP